ncbi:MAG: tetratricopeptide repeat protein [Nitrospirae bacterium]|nr:tetratricopeptide repeat protein [Nitrospirota bacterium]
MSADKNAVLAKAQLFASRGQYEKAIAEWTKLVTGTPADSTIFNTIGDLHLKRNATADAIEAYLQAGAAFRASGAAVKAIAIYKKILKLNPSSYKVYLLIGDLNAERGLITNAVAEYLTLAKLLLKESRRREAIEVYRKMVKLDPSNQELKQQFTELCHQESVPVDIVDASPQPVEHSSAQKRPQQAAAQPHAGVSPEAKQPPPPASSPAAETRKEQPEPRRQGYLEKAGKQINDGLYAEAESLLLELLDREPGDPEVCRLLAMLHLRRGDMAVARTEYRFLAEAAMRAHDSMLAESMIREYLAVDPDCVGLIELLGRVFEDKGDVQAAAVHYGKAIKLLVEHPDPEQQTLPAELFDRIKEVAPTSPVIDQLASVFEPVPVHQDSATPAAPVAEPLPVHQDVAAPAKPEPPPREPESQPSEAPAIAVGQAAPALEAAAPSREAPRAEVPERQGPPSDTEYGAHYELGLAYKNMGLPEEAIEEFQLAVNGAEWFMDSCRMLAACLKERGMNGPAIAYLEKSLADPRCVGDTAASVRYELGVLYEAEGQFDRALEMFSSIPTFLDVPRRLQRINRTKDLKLVS